MNPSPRFLGVEDVRRLHSIAIEDQGGDASVRDAGLLDAAVAMPRQQFGGEYLHSDIPSMAAAYAFHICKNHPFVDGNKRAATAAMIAFLADNGWAFDADVDAAEPVILKLAAGELEKDAWTEWVGKVVREKPRMELREFLSQLTMAQLFEHEGSVVNAGDPSSEWLVTVREASRFIPLIGELAEEFKRAREAGQGDIAALRAAEGGLLVHLYRIAEDKGYEW